MKFEEVLIELRKGKIIKRSIWNNHVLSNNINNMNNMLYVEDLLSDDWEVLEEPGKTFYEVFQAFKEGKKIKRKCLSANTYLTKNDCYYNLNAKDLLATDWEIINDCICGCHPALEKCDECCNRWKS